MIITGDCLDIMPGLEKEDYYCCVTSPPYWGLRDYGIPPSQWPEITYCPMPGLPTLTVPAWSGCLGLEPTPEMFIAHIVHVFRLVWRLLRKDGTLWLNLGDSYVSTAPGSMGDNIHIKGTKEETRRARKIKRRKQPNGLKPKDLVGIPWRAAFALQADGWYFRIDNIWSKPNPMPEAVRDRPTKAHEYVFLFSKSRNYYYDKEAIAEPAVGFDSRPPAGSTGAFGPKQSRRRGNAKSFRGGNYTDGQSFKNDDPQERDSHGNMPNETGLRNKRSVWTIATTQYTGAHYATYPKQIPEIGILAGCPVGGKVLDPFGGTGTTDLVAMENNREATIIEIGTQYVTQAEQRTEIVQPRLIL